MTTNQDASFTRRSRYGFIAFIVLIAVFCEIYSHKLNQAVPVASAPTATSTSTFVEPTMLPNAGDARAPADPFIDSIAPASGPVGTTITVTGTGFSGFEGGLTLWIQNAGGQRGILYATNVTTGASTTPNIIRVSLGEYACATDTSNSGTHCAPTIHFDPGVYQISTSPWGKQSNSVQFTVTAN